MSPGASALGSPVCSLLTGSTQLHPYNRRDCPRSQEGSLFPEKFAYGSGFRLSSDPHLMFHDGSHHLPLLMHNSVPFRVCRAPGDSKARKSGSQATGGRDATSSKAISSVLSALPGPPRTQGCLLGPDFSLTATRGSQCIPASSGLLTYHGL